MTDISGTSTATQLPASPAPSSPSPGSSLLSGSVTVTKNGTALSWATFVLIGYLWIRTTKLDHLPAWQPLVAVVVNALPAGMVTEIARTLVVALADKIPGRATAK